MTDPRLRTIRFWLASLVLLLTAAFCRDAALLWFASFAWLPLGLFMPVFGGGTLPANCDGSCTTLPVAQYQVVTSGFTNGGGCTTCGSYNGTWTVSETTCVGWPEQGLCLCAAFEISPCLCWNTAQPERDDGELFAIREIILEIDDTALGGFPRMDLHLSANSDFGFGTASCEIRDNTFAKNAIVSWSNNLSSPVDCGNLSAYHVVQSGEITSCAFDLSDAVVTAL